MTQQFVTTKDNPYDYFDEFDLWYQYDEDHGYHTCAYLARLCATSPADSDTERHDELVRVINEILELNITGNYVRVTRDIDE